ncbi:L-type lectin-domain containing receptor kinase IX.1-like [Chenopodium quinoa]|uniref:Protein kinase domain-containing protein n=1 Tax=Chenopodium quinoa TaxID=63459 RepID=A0A803LLR6_CHEQI|nr:L-type lectin-domain containing receptor kinase IX.1-like [Chenopodium quinoa]
MATSFNLSFPQFFRVNSICFPLIVALLLLSNLRIITSPSFNYSRFDSNSNLHFQGNAENSLGKIEFNYVSHKERVGIVTYGENVRLWDKSLGKIAEFSTHFTFVVDTFKAPRYGHGFTFFIAPVGFKIPPGSDGPYLGLFNQTTYVTSSTPIIVVEFDSFPNVFDPSEKEHVGININSLNSSAHRPWNASKHSKQPADVWINYNATAKVLNVFWSYKNDPNINKDSNMSIQIDITKVLPELVNIGFSAGTGVAKERHTLESWEFYSTLKSVDTTSDDPKEKIEFTNNNNSDDHPKDNKSKERIIIIVVVVSSFAFVAISGGMLVLFVHRKRKEANMKQDEETSFNDELERGVGPRRFSYSELESATNSFSSEHKLGKGGFGAVYKGYLNDMDLPIAVKKISRGSKQGKKEYIAEVKIISRLRHRNIVQLLGWCHDKTKLLLVYEFMPNGSLDCHLFGKKTPLSWPLRYKIAQGLASGLLYLHEEWEQCVVHRDIKSSNIMLDSNFNVKLGDFGLATLMEHGRVAQTITLAGTIGYIAPEYISTRKASKESDVYSFGVVALEIATGRRQMDPIDEGTNMKGLIQWVWDLYGNGRLLSASDQRLRREFDVKQVECLILVGLWCVHPDYNYRPSIKQAIQVLNFEAALPSLPPAMPIPTYHVPVLQSSDGSSCPSMLSTSLKIGR